MCEMPGGWVLIVEDDAVLARATVRLLRSEGLANVVAVGTAREARARARRSGLVAAIVDVGLPDANGIDVAVALRELHPHAEIAIWSAADDMAVVHAANAAGFEFITKLAATEVLRRRARRWAQLREQVSRRVLTVSERFLELRRRYALTDQQAQALQLALGAAHVHRDRCLLGSDEEGDRGPLESCRTVHGALARRMDADDARRPARARSCLARRSLHRRTSPR